MATFGNTTQYTNSSDGASNLLDLCKFTLSEDGDITKLTFYYNAPFSAGNIKAVVYADNSNYPGALLATSSSTSFAKTSPIVSKDVSLSVHLTAGVYWLGWVQEGTTTSLYTSTTGVGTTNQHRFKVDSFASPSNPAPASMSGDSALIDVYATYTPSAGSSSVNSGFFVIM